MGKGLRKACGNILAYAKSDKKNLRHLALSLIALIVASVVITTMTFSWFSVKTSVLEAKTFKLECGKGLRVNDSGTNELSFSRVDKYLIPGSSVDGRNLYFPTDGIDFSNVTSQMTFRSANAGDKNVNYIQIDFTLTAQQDHTALYINSDKTSLKVKSRNEDNYSVTQASALRSALWCSTAENGVPNTPIVFNPTQGTVYTAAVADVDRSNGAFIATGRQAAHAFSEYSFGNSPVATLSKNVVTKFSYIVWLEGTDPKCTDKIMNKDIEIKLAFTTSWDKTQSIRFRDDTSGNLVSEKMSDGYTMTLRYTNPGDDTDFTDFNLYPYNFEKDQTENLPEHKIWSCNIPGDMRNKITFILRPTSSSQSDNKTYTFTINSRPANGASATDSDPDYYTYDRGPNRLYVAETLDTANTDSCKGYWVAIGDSDGTGHDGGSMDGDDF